MALSDHDFLFGSGISRLASKEDVANALQSRDLRRLRQISYTFFNHSGIYNRLCRYMASLYRFDWYVTPVFDSLSTGVSEESRDSIFSQWQRVTSFLDRSRLRRVFGSIALKVVRDGCYYGYKMEQDTAVYLQELPASYCRSRYELNGSPAVEFNVRYFDDEFSADPEYKERLLKAWPKEIRLAYNSYRSGRLKKDLQMDETGWTLLDPAYTVKFNIGDTDIPLLMAVIPKIIDLADAQDLDRKKMLQQILRILIQQIPLDKNGIPVMDEGEMNEFHKNAVVMLCNAIGLNVLTTPCDVTVADMADHGNVSTVDQLDKIERSVYNEAGIAQAQFNSTSNMALEKSVAKDAATMTDLLLKFEDYANSIITRFYTKECSFLFQMLPTTIFNYQDMSDRYKSMATLGFSKLLPQVALGQSQSSIMMMAKFENEILSLNDFFVPPQSSATMSGNDGPGRPSLPDDKKSDKTIRNIESS